MRILNVLMSLVCVLAFTCDANAARGVVRPFGGWSNTVEVINSNNDVGNIKSVLASVPDDDSDKWHITLFVGEDSASRLLEQAFYSNPSLRAIASWGNFNVYRVASSSQKARFSSYEVNSTPKLCVYPPADSATWEYQYVFRQTGFNNDADQLARNIVMNIVEFAETPASRRQCPDNPCPTPSLPSVMPILPELPSLPDIPVLPVLPDMNTTDGTYPEYPQIALIIDPNGVGEELKAAGLELLARHIKEKFPEASSAKIVIIRLSDDAASAYPVGPEDTPAVFVTSRGKIIGYLNSGVLAILRDYLNLPEAPAVPDKMETLASEIKNLVNTTQEGDSGWSLGSVVAAASGGGLGVLALVAVVLLVVWRTRKRSGAVLKGVGGEVLEKFKALDAFLTSAPQPTKPVETKPTEAETPKA